VAEELLILASASPRRRELLRTIVPEFEVCPCHLEEPASPPTGLSPTAWALALAYFKARAVADQRPGRWVLAADTLVSCAGQVLGKPRDLEDARRMLCLQAGRASDVITGVCLARREASVRRILTAEATRVWMRDAPAEIEAYLAGGDWQGKAGAYGIQDIGDRLIERLEGSFSNVVGLPLERVGRILGSVGGPKPVRATPHGPPQRNCG